MAATRCARSWRSMADAVRWWIATTCSAVMSQVLCCCLFICTRSVSRVLAPWHEPLLVVWSHVPAHPGILNAVPLVGC